jgi:hypothetical protein
MNRHSASLEAERISRSNRGRFARMAVAGLVVLVVVLLTVAQVVRADAPTSSVGAPAVITPSGEPPTDTPAAPTNTPKPPADTPVPPTDTAVPPKNDPTAQPPAATPQAVLPQTGSEVDAPAQNDNSAATLGIVALGLVLVLGGVVLSRMNANRKSDNV